MLQDVVAVAVTLVDVVSGRIIKKLLHEGGTAPVHCLIIENFVITTYWNSQVIDSVTRKTVVLSTNKE